VYKSSSFCSLIQLTDLGFLFPDPGGGPCLRADVDCCIDGCNTGEGAPMDNEATDCDVFCFLRDPEAEGLAIGL
jgi:hypothetical protein